MKGFSGFRTAVLLFLLVVSAFSSIVSIPRGSRAYTLHDPISISYNGDFTVENGVVGGSGTPSDPYIISGWEIDASTAIGIEIMNVDKPFILRNVYVHSGSLSKNDGIRIFNVPAGRVEDVVSSDNLNGITLNGTSNAAVVGSRFHNNTLHGIVVGGATNATISANEAFDNMEGLYFEGRSGSKVLTNNLHNNSYGLVIVFSLDTRFASNNISGNDHGVYAYDSTNIDVSANEVSENRVKGVEVLYSSFNLTANNISRNQVGIDLASSTMPSVYHNNMINNVVQAIDDGVDYSWDGGYPSGGNFWSDYGGVDQFGGPSQNQPGADGIGDVPYVIDVNSRDSLPLMVPYVDNDAPIVSILTPLNGSVISATSIDVIGTATDAGGSGVDRVRARLNGGTWLTVAGTRFWSTSFDLIPGVNVIEAQSWDVSGNPSPIMTVVVTLDIAPPSITHTPVTEATVGEAFSVDAKVTDASGVHLVWLYYQFEQGMGGWWVVNMTPMGNDSYRGVVAAPKRAGAIYYFILARDKMGNEVEDPPDGHYTIAVKQRWFGIEIALLLLAATISVVAAVVIVLLLLIRKTRRAGGGKKPKTER